MSQGLHLDRNRMYQGTDNLQACSSARLCSLCSSRTQNLRQRYRCYTYQGMPEAGYTVLFENLLNHENIKIELGVDAKDVLTFDFENQKILVDGNEFNGPIVFTGAIDELFDCKLGQLPYRSLDFKFEHYDQEFYQSKGVVNYTVSEDYTRITEFKYLTGQVADTTTIIKEYPKKYTDPKTQVPYYAILSDENKQLHQKYVDLVKPFNNFYLLGRLAQYKYYNIDGIVLEALKFIGELL